MPRAFTLREREQIKAKLMEEAGHCLKLYGVRKTTVDELVRRANIPKGTFYLFYASKELLFYEVLCVYHDQLQSDLLNEIRAMDGPVSADRLIELLLGLYRKVEGSFMRKLIAEGELELLMRRLPPETARAHAETDDFTFEQLVAAISGASGGIDRDNIKTCSAAFRAIFLSMLHKREIGEEVFEDALRLLIRGVVLQMFEGVLN